MSKLIEVRHQVAIAGRVIESGVQKPIGGAMVRIIEMPPAFKSTLAAKALWYGSSWDAWGGRPDRTWAAADGIFYFLDLPDGKYTIHASLAHFGKRYGVGRGSADVSRDAKGNVKMAFLELVLQATTVHGKVTGAGHKSGVPMAEVRVKGSGERAFTDVNGEYVVAGVEPGKRTLQVYAQGYRQTSKVVALGQAGALEPLNFTLVREAG